MTTVAHVAWPLPIPLSGRSFYSPGTSAFIQVTDALRRDDVAGSICARTRSLSKTGEIGRTKTGRPRVVSTPPAVGPSRARARAEPDVGARARSLHAGNVESRTDSDIFMTQPRQSDDPLQLASSRSTRNRLDGRCDRGVTPRSRPAHQPRLDRTSERPLLPNPEVTFSLGISGLQPRHVEGKSHKTSGGAPSTPSSSRRNRKHAIKGQSSSQGPQPSTGRDCPE
jgi:hypothetical protein